MYIANKFAVLQDLLYYRRIAWNACNEKERIAFMYPEPVQTLGDRSQPSPILQLNVYTWTGVYKKYNLYTFHTLPHSIL